MMLEYRERREKRERKLARRPAPTITDMQSKCLNSDTTIWILSLTIPCENKVAPTTGKTTGRAYIDSMVSFRFWPFGDAPAMVLVSRVCYEGWCRMTGLTRIPHSFLNDEVHAIITRFLAWVDVLLSGVASECRALRSEERRVRKVCRSGMVS